MRTPNNERLTPDIVDAAGVRNVSEPQRRCILSGEHATRHSLVRLAISPDGLVLPDAGAKAPGRGAWIGVSRFELEQAIAKGQMKAALARAFKGEKLVLPDDLPEQIERALKKALTDRLGLEMRAGTLVLGSDRIAEQARMGRLALLLHAADASEDGRSKLDQAWRVGREIEGSGARGVVLPLDRMALSVALGRDNVVHVAVGYASAADRIANAVGRLQQYLAGAKPD